MPARLRNSQQASRAQQPQRGSRARQPRPDSRAQQQSQATGSPPIRSTGNTAIDTPAVAARTFTPQELETVERALEVLETKTATNEEDQIQLQSCQIALLTLRYVHTSNANDNNSRSVGSNNTECQADLKAKQADLKARIENLINDTRERAKQPESFQQYENELNKQPPHGSTLFRYLDSLIQTVDRLIQTVASTATAAPAEVSPSGVTGSPGEAKESVSPSTVEGSSNSVGSGDPSPGASATASAPLTLPDNGTSDGARAEEPSLPASAPPPAPPSGDDGSETEQPSTLEAPPAPDRPDQSSADTRSTHTSGSSLLSIGSSLTTAPDMFYEFLDVSINCNALLPLIETIGNNAQDAGLITEAKEALRTAYWNLGTIDKDGVYSPEFLKQYETLTTELGKSLENTDSIPPLLSFRPISERLLALKEQLKGRLGLETPAVTSKVALADGKASSIRVIENLYKLKKITLCIKKLLLKIELIQARIKAEKNSIALGKLEDSLKTYQTQLEPRINSRQVVFKEMLVDFKAAEECLRLVALTAPPPIQNEEASEARHWLGECYSVIGDAFNDPGNHRTASVYTAEAAAMGCPAANFKLGLKAKTTEEANGYFSKVGRNNPLVYWRAQLHLLNNKPSGGPEDSLLIKYRDQHRCPEAYLWLGERYLMYSTQSTQTSPRECMAYAISNFKGVAWYYCSVALKLAQLLSDSGAPEESEQYLTQAVEANHFPAYVEKARRLIQDAASEPDLLEAYAYLKAALLSGEESVQVKARPLLDTLLQKNNWTEHSNKADELAQSLENQRQDALKERQELADNNAAQLPGVADEPAATAVATATNPPVARDAGEAAARMQARTTPPPAPLAANSTGLPPRPPRITSEAQRSSAAAPASSPGAAAALLLPPQPTAPEAQRPSAAAPTSSPGAAAPPPRPAAPEAQKKLSPEAPPFSPPAPARRTSHAKNPLGAAAASGYPPRRPAPAAALPNANAFGAAAASGYPPRHPAPAAALPNANAFGAPAASGYPPGYPAAAPWAAQAAWAAQAEAARAEAARAARAEAARAARVTNANAVRFFPSTQEQARPANSFRPPAAPRR